MVIIFTSEYGLPCMLGERLQVQFAQRSNGLLVGCLALVEFGWIIEQSMAGCWHVC